MITLIAYGFIFVIIGIFKFIGLLISLPFKIIELLSGKDIIDRDASSPEYDEFDIWQDDQGL